MLRVIEKVNLTREGCEVDGAMFKCDVGNWAFWIPALSLKLLHSWEGAVHCIHKRAPTRESVFTSNLKASSRYSQEEWIAAYSKDSRLRAAENVVAARRLARHGLGPQVHGACLVRELRTYYGPTGHTAGMIVEDLSSKRRKPDCTYDEMIAAGVFPDKSLSCLRQQINGYVSDLNSAVGVRPIDADAEVTVMTQLFFA